MMLHTTTLGVVLSLRPITTLWQSKSPRHTRNNIFRTHVMSHSLRNGARVLSMAGDSSECSVPNRTLTTIDVIEHLEASPSQAELDIMRLAQSHFTSQALLAAIRIGALDVLAVANGGDSAAASMTVDEIIAKIQAQDSSGVINNDALFRCLRLLCTSGVIEETINDAHESAYLLTEVGRLLQRSGRNGDTPSMASFALHWSELPLWNAWSELPDYVAGKCSSLVDLTLDDVGSRKSFQSNLPPFDRANGMSASDFYEKNAASCSHRNAVARYASSKEITSILNAMQCSSVLNESNLAGKTVVDVGGGYGDLIHAIESSMPTVGQCYCLDLPDVIDDAISTNNKIIAKLVPGNMFDPSTIPPCDFIFTKHVLCDFSDKDVVSALQSFHKSLSSGGKLVIMDAVLPNGGDLNGKWNPAVSFDVLLMLTGRRGERSRVEWSNLGRMAGFVLEDVLSTSSVTVDLAVLSRNSVLN